MMFPHHHQYDSRFVNQAFGDVYETFSFHMRIKWLGLLWWEEVIAPCIQFQ